RGALAGGTGPGHQSGNLHIPTKQKRRSPGRGAKEPLDHQRPEKKMDPAWHLRPRAFAPQASVMASGVREGVATSITVSFDGVKAKPSWTIPPSSLLTVGVGGVTRPCYVGTGKRESLEKCSS